MKNYYKFLFLVLVLIYSCTTSNIEEEIIAEEPVNKVKLAINGQDSANRINGLTASISCSKTLTISFDNFVDTENGNYYGGTGLNLRLDTNGNLLSLWYKTNGPSKDYYSPFFNPVATLDITNFEFIENQILKVNVSGQIFKKSHNFFDAPEAVTINAEIEIKEFQNCICDTYVSNISNYNDFIFDGLTKRQQLNAISYYSNTNNGYQIEFLNFNEAINNMPLGTYVFDENSTSHRIDFRKFIGVPRAFYNKVIPEEWLEYKTSGSFEIIEKVQIGNELVTKVKFDVTAKHNNVIVFQFNNVIMQTQM